MRTLEEIIKERLDQFCSPHNQRDSLLGQLLLTVFNEETPDDLCLNMYDRDSMEQDVFDILYLTDQKALSWLCLTDPEQLEDFTMRLEEAKTIEEVRELLVLDILWDAMIQRYDWFPHRV